ncbi:transferase [Absidia repens]|uniref:Transferase n=1 Tax=Absidia repens TaxID=90262 RepID=A0A1X2HX30_9FUNG|nr:transferase [Absidia repens]
MTTVETSTIYPTNKHHLPSPPSVITLHGLDLLSAPIQIHNHRFFHAPSSTTFADIIDTLKASLAEALEFYPPVTGTVLTNDENGDVYISLADKDILGTPFLVDIKPTAYDGDKEDLSPRTDAVLPPLTSSLAVKVTQFSCGTIAVASSINHQVTDLRGFLDFLEVWAKIARGEPIDLTAIPQDWAHQPGRFFSGLANDDSKMASPPFTALPHLVTGPPAFLLVSSAVTRWKLTKSATEQLKHDFSSQLAGSTCQNEQQWISSGDAIAALVSGAITRARQQGNVTRLDGRSSEGSETEAIAMAADGRDRAPNRNMANGHYFGNFNPLWSAATSRADLSTATCEAGARVALAIRTALKKQLSPEAIANKIAFFEQPELTHPRPGRISWAADIILTNWCRFDLQGPAMDLGWGSPFHATPSTGGVFPPGYSLMTMNKASGDIFMLITVEADAEKYLISDSLLTSYASLDPAHTN